LITAAQGKQEREQAEQKRQEAVVSSINWRWRKFALGIMNGKMNYRAYADAYDLTEVEINRKQYQVAAANASVLLKNAKFREYWRELLQEQGFNNDAVDSEMLQLITDPMTPPTVKRAAIKDYNELMGRIVKAVDLTSGGKPIPILGLTHEVPTE